MYIRLELNQFDGRSNERGCGLDHLLELAAEICSRVSGIPLAEDGRVEGEADLYDEEAWEVEAVLRLVDLAAYPSRFTVDPALSSYLRHAADLLEDSPD